MFISEIDTPTLVQYMHNFREEIELALDNKPSSLSNLQNKLPSESLVKSDEEFQVIVFGGSNTEKAWLKFSEGKYYILERKKSDFPLISSKKIFNSVLEQNLSPESHILSLNMAYPLEPLTRGKVMDGKLLRGTKEHSFEGIVGKNIGEYIQEFHGSDDLIVNVANDTVCLLASGLTTLHWSNFCGGVVGTGLNFAFFLDEKTTLNLEAAYFDKFTLSESSEYVDSISLDVGKSKAEKEISGKYLYEKYNFYARQKGLAQIQSTQELGAKASENLGVESDLAKSLINKSAEMLAVIIGGLVSYKKLDKLNFVMEGSVFWNLPNYQEYIYENLKRLDISKEQVKFHRIENSPIIGAAKLIAF